MPESLDDRARKLEIALLELRVEAERMRQDAAHHTASNLAAQTGRELSPLLLTLAGAIVTGIFAILNSFFQAQQSHQIEMDKLRSTLIQKAVSADDPEERKKTLLFFVETGLISDQDGKIQSLKSSQIPQVVPSGEVIRMDGGTYEHIGEAFVMRCGLRISADGSPRAYHHDSKLALDFLQNAGREKKWWALVTDSKGEPVVQGKNDPAPGYYISKTALEDRTKLPTDPHRYVDSSTIPYVVVPSGMVAQKENPHLGDLAAVYNNKTGRLAYAIVADIGPKSKIGEGSIALAEQLGVPSDPRNGGLEEEVIIMVVFPGSGNGSPQPLSEIQAGASRRFEKWGGLTRLKVEPSATTVTEDAVQPE